jgi:hypothetical protein
MTITEMPAELDPLYQSLKSGESSAEIGKTHVYPLRAAGKTYSWIENHLTGVPEYRNLAFRGRVLDALDAGRELERLRYNRMS